MACGWQNSCRPWSCNYLQNAGATTYKNFLQFYAKKACKKHLKVEDKYYKKYNRMLERWEIVVKYNNKEKEVEVSKDDFYEIKVGDKVLCDVYCQGKKIVAIELNEHWNET